MTIDKLRVIEARPARPNDRTPFDIVLLSYRERGNAKGEFECCHGDLISFGTDGIRVSHGTRLILSDGRHIEAIAAEEHLAEIIGPALSEWGAWLADRDIPRQEESDRLLIARDPCLEEELRQRGAIIRHISEPFEPVAT